MYVHTYVVGISLHYDIRLSTEAVHSGLFYGESNGVSHTLKELEMKATHTFTHNLCKYIIYIIQHTRHKNSREHIPLLLAHSTDRQ